MEEDIYNGRVLSKCRIKERFVMMKINWKKILWTLCFGMGVWLAFPAQTAKAEEKTENLPVPLTILDFKISSKTAKPGDNINYSFILAETGLKEFSEKCGEGFEFYYDNPKIFDVTIYWKSPRKPGTESREWDVVQQKIVHTFDWEETSAKQKKLKVSGTIPVMKGMQSGTWFINSIECSLSEDSTLLLVNQNKNPKSSYGCILMDFSMADFTVTGTGRADYKAPRIDLKSLKLSKKYVKRNQKSIFQVKVKDATKIKKVECEWKLYDKKNRYAWNRDYKMTYNKKKKSYQCSIKLDTKYYKKARLSCIYVQDIYGNEGYYSVDYSYIPEYELKYYNAYKKMIIRKK